MKPRKKIRLSYNPITQLEELKELEGIYSDTNEDLIDQFEERLCALTGSPYVVALSSGTAAIHLGLKVLGVVQGDEVPVSTFTYVGSVNPICYEKARPVFIDSEPLTWNMDPNLLEDYFRQRSNKNIRPKVVEIVHTYGMPAKMDDLMAITSRYDVPILEDAAAGIGSTYQGKSLGTLGEIGVISFNNNKLLTTYGGGALLTGRKDIYDKVKWLATQALESKPYYECKEVGYNYRMGPLNAAYGLVQLKTLRDKIESRKKVFMRYKKAFAEVGGLSFQPELAESYSNRWLTAILLDKEVGQPEQTRQVLEDAGLEFRRLWKPMHLQPLFKNVTSFLGGTSESLYGLGLCLPSGGDLSQLEIDRICKALLNEL